MESFYYITVGAGISDVVVAARLREKIHSASILPVEAGKDETISEVAKYAKYIGQCVGFASTRTSILCLKSISLDSPLRKLMLAALHCQVPSVDGYEGQQCALICGQS